ncbi:hypothetical protein ACFLZL_05140 [Thermodesulfobacteriota bacterium]
MTAKNPLDSFIEKQFPEPLKKYADQIIIYFVFIAGLTLMGWFFDNRFLISLGLGSLLIYVVVMVVVIVNLFVLKK